MTRTDPTAALTELLAHHERSVAAIKTTLALCRAAASQNGQSLDAFVLARTAAFDGRGELPAPTVVRKAGTKRAKHRAAIRRKLNAFSTTTPRPGSGHGLGPLVSAGYLKRKGDGYLRTDKVYA